MAICPLFSGCVTYTDAHKSGVHFGIVKIDKNDTNQQNVEYSHLSSAGIWLEKHNIKSSAGLGFRKSSTIHSPPKCQVTVIIKSVAEAEQIINLISNISNEEGELCIGKI